MKKLTTLNPQPFPKGDKNYIDKFYLNRPNVHHYLYDNGNPDEIIFVVYIEDKPDGTKRVQQGSYNNGKYEKCNAWTQVKGFKKPLYDKSNLLLTDKEILLVEGEKKCLIARKLFPNMFVTTYQGGRSGWKNNNIDFSSLEGRTVKVWPDIDVDGKGQSEWLELTRYLNKEFKLEASFVELPNYTEFKKLYEESEGEEYLNTSWDLANNIPGVWQDKLNDFVSGAVKPEPLAEIEYSNIDEDLDRWIYIASSGVLYYDKKKNKYAKDKEINNLYRRDRDLKGDATRYLQQKNCPYVDRQTFRPGGKFIFEEDNIIYLNRYRKPKWEKITKNTDYDISIWRDHLRLLTNDNEDNFRHLENIIASDIQHPERNRKFAVIFNSSQGVGKSLFFNALKKLYGESNCSDLNMKQLTGQYQSHMLDSNYLFVNEIDSSAIEDRGRRSNFKTLVDGEDHMVELKGVDQIKVNCHYTIWGATNETIPMYMAEGERRTFYLEIEKTKPQILEEKPNYFEDFINFISSYDRMNEVFDYYRYKHKISEDFDLAHAPLTVEKEELIKASRPEYMKYLDDLLEERKIESFKYDLINFRKTFKEVLRYAIDDDLNPLKQWKENYIKRWVQSNKENFSIADEGIKQADGKRIRFWCVRNYKLWSQYKNNYDTIEAHLDNLFDTKVVTKNKTTFEQQQEAWNG
jgi:hypothetical protein